MNSWSKLVIVTLLGGLAYLATAGRAAAQYHHRDAERDHWRHERRIYSEIRESLLTALGAEPLSPSERVVGARQGQSPSLAGQLTLTTSRGLFAPSGPSCRPTCATIDQAAE